MPLFFFCCVQPLFYQVRLAECICRYVGSDGEGSDGGGGADADAAGASFVTVVSAKSIAVAFSGYWYGVANLQWSPRHRKQSHH